MAKDILLVAHNHFDPTWRRCFDRPASYHGTTLQSYAKVEELCINAWLRLAGRGYTFSEGQVAVWRKYLEHNPSKKRQLQNGARAGLLDIMRAGEVVQDSVMPTAEGLVRNFLSAEPFYRALVGEDHATLKLAWLEDAFGNSPNYPQVLKGVGADVACNFSYRPCQEEIWVGIDGTKIFCYDNHPALFFGAFAKHRPCPDCNGKGCKSCKHTGFLLIKGFNIPALRKVLEQAAASKGEWIEVRILTEEVLPDPNVVTLVSELNRKFKGKAQIRFANPSDVYERYLPTLKAALKRRDNKPSADLNPAMPGCMVSRIRLKQRTRALAYHLVAAEAVMAGKAWNRGKPTKPHADMATAWQLVAFNQFHDAITGTHIDNANVELTDMLDKAQKIADKRLPLPRKQADLGKLKRVSGGAAKRKLGKLSVTFDIHGILAIHCGRRNLFAIDQPLWNNTRRPYRIAELLLEPDYGDPWGRRIPPPHINGWEDFSLIGLGEHHVSVEASDRAVRWTGKYNGGDFKVKKLEWTVTALPSPDGQRLDFETDLNWDTGSRRIRVVVPVASAKPTATYEVPFGFIDRTYDESQLKYDHWTAHQMEFPTLHWLLKTVDKKSGVALLNKGLPCNRWAPTRMDLSLVRSPEWGFGLSEPASYEFWDFDGMRDTGRHRFEYSLLPYVNGLSIAELTRIGYAYNMPAPIELPFRIEGAVVVTAWKLAEDGNGWILRVQESSGKGTKVTLKFNEPHEVTVTNLLEQPEGKSRRGKRYGVRLHKHGILTLRIRF